MGWMSASPQYSYVETLIPHMIVLEGEEFGMWLGHEGEASMIGLVPI